MNDALLTVAPADMPDKVLKPLLKARRHPALVEVHVPSPATAGSPMTRPRFWHTLHRNNLNRMMFAAGSWEAIGYELHGHGEGATILYANWSLTAETGLIPDAVQEYIVTEFGADGWDIAESIVKAVKVVLSGVAMVFPASAPAITVINSVLTVAEEAAEVIEGDDDDDNQ